jgi:hypothetical protein
MIRDGTKTATGFPNPWMCKLSLRVVAASLILLAVCRANAITASEFDHLRAADETVRAARTIEDLKRAATSFPTNTPTVRDGLAYMAAVISLPDEFGRTPKAEQYAIRLAVFSALLDAQSHPNMPLDLAVEDLYTLGPASLKALGKISRLGTLPHPAYRLLARGPQISQGQWMGEYHSLSLTIGRDTLIFESSDTPWRDLGRELRLSETHRTEAKASADSSGLPLGNSYVFPLNALDEVIVAAKASACAEATSSPAAKAYLELLAVNALYQASSADLTQKDTVAHLYRRLLPNLDEWAGRTDQIRSDLHFSTRLTGDNLAPRLNAAEFFASNLKDALQGYEKAANATEREVSYRVYGAIGSGICQLSTNPRQAAVRFQDAFRLLKTNSDRATADRYKLASIIEAVDGPELLGSVAKDPALGEWKTPDIPLDTRYLWDLDIVGIFYVLGKPQAAERFLEREISFVRASNSPDRYAIEAHLVREIGASTSDLFALLSWTTPELRPQLRTAIGVDPVTEFAPTVIDTKLPGLRVPAGKRYGMTDPEEDRATCIELYDPSNFGLFKSVITQVETVLHLTMVLKAPPPAGYEFRNWVRSELAANPAHVKPLLKLAWVEWFQIPLAGVGTSNVNLTSWHYSPGDSDGVTTISNIESVMARGESGVDAQTRSVWESFRSARLFLSRNYIK